MMMLAAFNALEHLDDAREGYTMVRALRTIRGPLSAREHTGAVCPVPQSAPTLATYAVR